MNSVYDVRLSNMRLLIDQAGGNSAFAEKIERDPTMVSRCAGKNPRRQIGASLARHVESKLGLPTGWLDLVHGQAAARMAGLEDGNVRPVYRVPLLSRVQAGCWRESLDSFDYDEAVFVDVAGPVGPGAFALRVEGDSMVSPSGGGIPDGAIAIVEPGVEATSGRVVVARVNGSSEATIKKLVVDAGEAMLVPLNPRYPVIGGDRHWEIVGVVTRFQCEI
jgi:SOS-response transcriptional repressor LexA